MIFIEMVTFAGLDAKDIRGLQIDHIDLATTHDTVLKLPLCKIIKVKKFYSL